MKILFVCENYIPHYGGVEVVFKNLAEGLVARGHEVHIVTQRLKGTKKDEVLNGVNVHRVNALGSRYLFSFLAIPAVLRLAKEMDVIQTTTFNGAPPAWIAAKIRRRPVVMTVHEVWVGKWRKTTELNWFSAFVHDLLERAIYWLPYDEYVCVSNATLQDLLARRISKEKARTIYNGLDYDFWNNKRFNPGPIRERLGVRERFMYFSWGRPGTSKGFEYLIRAVPIVAKKFPMSVCVLMLSNKDTYPKQYAALEDLVEKLGISRNCKIIPSVPYEQLGDYIVAADAVVIPSIAEGFGYTTVEAGALDKIVVATTAGSLPEVVGGNHILVPPKDSVRLAEGIIDVINKKYVKSKKKQFLWSTAIDQYISIYKRLTKK